MSSIKFTKRNEVGLHCRFCDTTWWDKVIDLYDNHGVVMPMKNEHFFPVQNSGESANNSFNNEWQSDRVAK